MTYPVKWFTSAMTGAPSLAGTAGGLIALLDACLVNGFGTLTLTSLSVSGGVATATIDAGHDYPVHSVIEIAGASPSGLNGEHRVTASAATTFTFDTTAADGAATGTITAKIPPLDSWSKAFSGTNKAAYRPTDPAATGLFLRLDDSGGHASAGYRFAEVRGYETMSDVDTGTGLFPTATQEASDGIIYKSYDLNSNAKDWVLVGDSHGFYFFPSPRDSYEVCRGGYWFGDIVSYAAADAYCAMLITQDDTASYTSAPGHNGAFAFIASGASVVHVRHHLARSYTQLGAAVAASKHGNYTLGGAAMGIGYVDHPNPAGNGLIASDVQIFENDCVRGVMPGVSYPLHARPVADLSEITDMADLPGRKLLAVDVSRSSAWSNADSGVGQLFIDLTGPWR